MRLLLIEDDPELGDGIARGLRGEGFVVTWVVEGSEGLYQAREWEWDLIVLDRMLPDMEGIAVLAELRKSKATPVLMLTALNMVEHRLEGLESGADDYLGKPFEFRELLARLKALARRAYGLQGSELRHGDLRLDPENRRVVRSDKALSLSASEFSTLEYLLLRRGKVVSRRRLEDLLGDDGQEISDNTLDVHMHRLRSKIGEGVIQTKRGQGYLIGGEAEKS